MSQYIKIGFLTEVGIHKETSILKAIHLTTLMKQHFRTDLKG